jgi:hypothetical protein
MARRVRQREHRTAQGDPGEVSHHVNAAVTGLQFQDMTSQLLERIVRRVIGLREALGC